MKFLNRQYKTKYKKLKGFGVLKKFYLFFLNFNFFFIQHFSKVVYKCLQRLRDLSHRARGSIVPWASTSPTAAF